MKKGAKKINIKINFTNRWLYTFIALGILIVVGISVYALTPGTVPNPGHDIQTISPPIGCSANQFLQFNGSNWVCSSPSNSICPTGLSLKYTINYNEQETNDCSSFSCSSYYQQNGGYAWTQSTLYSDTCNGDKVNKYTCTVGETKTCQDSSGTPSNYWVTIKTCKAVITSEVPYCS